MKSGLIVINLDRSTERMARMHDQLSAAGLNYHRLSATDARTLSAEERNRYYSPALNGQCYHKQLAPGEVACYISHLVAWRLVLAKGWDYATILEDDVELTPLFGRALDQIHALPAGWDLIKLGAGGRRKRTIHRQPLDGGFDLCDYHKIPTCTHAQAISHQGARRLLESCVPFGRPIDVDLQHSWEKGVTVLGLEPYTANAADIESEIWAISGRRDQPRNPLRRCLNGVQDAWRRLRYNTSRHGLAAALRLSTAARSRQP